MPRERDKRYRETELLGLEITQRQYPGESHLWIIGVLKRQLRECNEQLNDATNEESMGR